MFLHKIVNQSRTIVLQVVIAISQKDGRHCRMFNCHLITTCFILLISVAIKQVDKLTAINKYFIQIIPE